MLRLVLALSVVVALTGCHPGAGTSPELRVLGVHQAAESHVFVQVSNPARQPMRLTKLEYTFASSKGTVAEGELTLYREIPSGAVAVLEVPLDAETTEPLQMRGRLTAELDQIVRTFKLSAQIQPH